MMLVVPITVPCIGGIVVYWRDFLFIGGIALNPTHANPTHRFGNS